MTEARRRGFLRTAARRGVAVVGACGVLALTLAGGLTPVASAQADSTALRGWCSRPGVSARLDRAVSAALRTTKAPGAIVGVWSPYCGYEKAFGVANKATKAPMRTDFYSRIGSETKTFTITALLQLVDAGKIRLDDPISKYIDGVPNGHRITLRMMARMQSGLYNYTADLNFGRKFATDPYQHFTPRQLLRYAFAHPPVFPPGRGWQYSNTNTVLIGLVIEKVSGLPLHTFIQRHIITPVGLTHTLFPTGNEFPNPHAAGYTSALFGTGVVRATHWNPSWGWAAGAMISTLEDLRTWSKVVATGTLLKPSTQAQRLQTVPLPGFLPRVGYGLGIFTAEGWIGHNGSLPGYQSLTLYLPKEQTSLVVLLNTDINPPGEESSSAFGTAVTGVITPTHVFRLTAAPSS